MSKSKDLFNHIAESAVIMSNPAFSIRHKHENVLAVGLALAFPVKCSATHYLDRGVLRDPPAFGIQKKQLLLFTHLDASTPIVGSQKLPYPMRDAPLIEFVQGWVKHAHESIVKPEDEDCWFEPCFLIRNGKYSDDERDAACVIETDFIELHK